MKKAKFEPLPLREVMRGGMSALAIPKDNPPRVQCELDGDKALASQRYQEALDSYKAAKGSSWRLKAKMGMCCVALGFWDEGRELLKEAPQRGEALPLGLFIDCIAQPRAPDAERRAELRELTRALMGLPDLYPYAFELAEKHLPVGEDRLHYLATGYELFPQNARVRRDYTRALWLSCAYRDEDLLGLVQACAGRDNPEQEDLWLGYEISASLAKYDQALSFLRPLFSAAEETSQIALALVQGDVLMLEGEFETAAAVYRETVAEAMKPEHGLMDVALAAARGLFRVALQTKDRGEIDRAAATVFDIFRCYGLRGMSDVAHPFRPEPVFVHIGSRQEWYVGAADLREVPLTVFDSLTDSDLRAWFKVLYALREEAEDISLPGDVGTMSEDDALSLILGVGEASANPYIKHQVALALMKTQQFEAAGRAFASLEWASILEIPGCWYAGDDTELLGDSSYDQSAAVDSFASGMIDELLTQAIVSPEWVGEDLYEVLKAYLRDALLRHKLHDRFHEMMKRLIDLHQARGEEPAAGHWFDYGLACHYKKLNGEAISAYQACLELAPDFAAARTNLMMLLPPKDRKAAIIEEALRSAPSLPTPLAAADLSLEQAVYLLTLYRACGGAEQDLTLSPFGWSEVPFAPTTEMRAPLFDLVRAGLIRISSQSPATAFDVDENAGKVAGYYTHNLYWDLPAASMGTIREIEAATLSGDWPAHWRAQVPKLAHELARHECLAYLRHCMDERKMPMPNGEKTFLMIDNILSTYSVAQAYAIFWQGAAGATDFLRRENVSVTHAANTIVGNCQRKADRARAEGWEIKPFARPKQARRSEFSHVLHDAFTGFGDRSFSVPLPELFETAAEPSAAQSPRQGRRV